MLDHSLLHKINTFIFDVDGVFTDGKILVTESGELLRSMHTRDGQALVLALEAGYTIAIITKGYSAGVRKRFEKLGITHIYDSLKEKKSAFHHFVDSQQIEKENIVYMGDDIPDLPIFDLVSIAACPKDAVPEVIAKCNYISPKKGGQGCVRELIERVMRVQGKWNHSI
ncbi:MAG: HAD hydrolase family protein [Saprospiraceae bacterium]|nr:HAD hydrolase family protein [Saprospiraceae bacterium]